MLLFMEKNVARLQQPPKRESLPLTACKRTPRFGVK